MVGLVAVFQQTPRAVMGAPPSLVILPPEVADEAIMLVTASVDKTGTVAAVNDLIALIWVVSPSPTLTEPLA